MAVRIIRDKESLSVAAFNVLIFAPAGQAVEPLID